MTKLPKLRRGDLILIHWADITGSVNESARGASTTYCLTPGFYHSKRKNADNGIMEFICTPTRHLSPVFEPSGWDAYPEQVIIGIEILKRANEVRMLDA